MDKLDLKVYMQITWKEIIMKILILETVSYFHCKKCGLIHFFVVKIVKILLVSKKKLVDASGKSLRTVKRIMKSLQEKNYIRRKNGKRYREWEVLI